MYAGGAWGKVKPGTWGDYERLYREEILPAKVRLDLAYVENHTVWGDLSAVLRTCLLPIVKTGYRVAARFGAGPAARAMAVRFAGIALGGTLLLGLFLAEAGAPA